jgi:peptide/nickel transport system substrate-binding protein
MNYAFLLFNLHDGASTTPHPVLGDAGVRRALAMALDRRAMLQNVFEGNGRLAMGPFSSMQWSADSTLRQPTFDRAGAAALLDSLGWKPGADGMRAKSGRPLAFTVIAASSSKPRQQYAQLIQEQLRQIGVKVEIEVMDPPAIGAKVASRAFDSFIANLTAGRSPAAGLRQSWYKGSTLPGGLNFGGYVNPIVDLQADSAFAAPTTVQARPHYRAAYQQIIDDAPAIFLFEQPTISGAHTRLVTGALRPGAWWTTLDRWSIAPGGHLPRDIPPEIPRDAPPHP